MSAILEMRNRKDGGLCWGFLQAVFFLWCVYLFLGIFPLIYSMMKDKK